MLSLTKAEKKKIRIEIGRILDQNCRGCKVRKQKRQKLGEFEQVHYCNTQCEIGQKLQELGRMLEGKPKRKRRVVAVSQTILTKEKYLELKAKGANDLKVALEFNLKIADLSKLKKEWGMEGYRLPPVKNGGKTMRGLMLHLQERCRECQISLTDFERSEYDGLCIDCWREERSVKGEKAIANMG